MSTSLSVRQQSRILVHSFRQNVLTRTFTHQTVIPLSPLDVQPTLYSWQDCLHGIPPEDTIERPEIEYGPRLRTVCFRGVPVNCSVTRLLEEIKFGPIERVTVKNDHILLQFFDARAASRCITELNTRHRNGMTCEMDQFISPPLLATTVAHLGLHNASRAVNVSYDAYRRRNKEPPTEESCRNALSAYGEIESVQFVEKTRFGGPSHGLVFRYLDIESSIEALAALRKGLPGFEDGSTSGAYVQDSSSYRFPEWYSPTSGQNRPSTVVLSDIQDMAPVMPAIRTVLRKLGPPAKAYGTFILNKSFCIQFVSPDYANDFRELFRPDAERLGIHTKLKHSNDVGRPAPHHGLLTAIDLGMTSVLYLKTREPLSSYNVWLLREMSPGAWVHRIIDGFIVNFPDVFYAMQLLLLLASGNHGFEGLEGVPVTFFGGLDITPVLVAAPQNRGGRARGVSTHRRATQALGLNI
ncbi:hypothetical protein IW261DRAFT_11390 [Armillaria novae-zelandiae]|uniref:RRM domain-containing protein n=1 Tax=Armillaria novae-zelandiae TaxID=153914 RepID=A0AA39UJJ9_9AGAR|nr:hypothetical protein IW261DRAFT_11390 [Armillaria novae-zelandiae]